MPNRKPLPDVDDGMVINGHYLMPTPHVGTFHGEKVPNAAEAQKLVAGTRRKLADMPLLPKQLNGVSAILIYTLSGLSDAEITVATGVDAAQIKSVREHEAYQQLQSYVVAAVQADAADEVREILASGVKNAAKKIVKLAESVDEKVALTASRDLLDRGGHNTLKDVDPRTAMLGTLRIEVVDKRNAAIPVIDMEVG